MIAGIDYGSKMAGTTVIAFEQNGLVKLISSKKNQDADQMILNFVAEHQPDLIGLDAPLSLPGVYTGLAGCSDYFYRACDKALKAMSPMFLGGLTARAMKLRSAILSTTEFIEVYPGMAAKGLELKQFFYKKKEAQYGVMLNRLLPELEFKTPIEINTSHEFDALLALYITKKYRNGSANEAGDAIEGVIYY